MIYKLFFDLLNKVRVGNVNNDVERLQYYKKNLFMNLMNTMQAMPCTCIYAENESSMKNNDLVLNDLLGEVYTIEADEKFQIIVNTYWQQLKLHRFKNEQTNTGCLAKLLKLKVGVKVILTVNLDIRNSLIIP